MLGVHLIWKTNKNYRAAEKKRLEEEKAAAAAEWVYAACILCVIEIIVL